MLNRISLRQMEYFVATAECGSIATASTQIHVSSPSISAAIAHMESELGVQLFVRHPAKGLNLTSIGTQVMAECQHILEQMGNLYAIANESANAIQGVLRVGIFQVFAAMIAPEVVYGFSRAFKSVRIMQTEGDQELLMQKLRSTELDVALTYDLHLEEDIQFEPLAQLPPHVLVSELHPLASCNTVSLEELVQYPMVLLDMPQSNEYFMSLFLSANLQPRIHARSHHADVVRSMVANDIGYALFNVRPKCNYSLDGKRLVRVHLAGKHRPMLLGLATYKPVQQSHLVKVFMQRCRAYISDQYIPGMGAPKFFDPHAVAVSAPSQPPSEV